ncbi:hypothetical protein [Hydrogenophaga palleronii]|uniref:hypothetical protein n=1 Tax=Hydrogenophaga palleronii TaxID=65655 RepID=UPI000A72AC65|nr:hypothetical protein [Hydrogenophaga palleronii]
MGYRMSLCFLVVILLGGCASIDSYHTKHTAGGCVDDGSTQCDDAIVIHKNNPDYSLAFLEVDDQGVMHNRDQMRHILDLVKVRGNSYIIVFVHGWHSNAKPNNANMKSFERRLEFTKRRYPTLNVVGIYVGWRGKSIEIPYVAVTTFWDRKNTSEEVGRNGLLEFLLRLEAAVRKHDDNTLLAVGHSLGGSVIFNALSPILLERLVSSPTPKVRGYGDLVVLINPAIEAMRYTALRDAAQVHQREQGFPSSQGPVFMVAAAEGDDAVKYAFPLGRSFSTLLERHREFEPPSRGEIAEKKIDQGSLDRFAIGQFERYTTHSLVANASSGNNDECKSPNGWLVEAVKRRKRSGDQTGEGWDTGWNSRGPEDQRPLLGDASMMQVIHKKNSAAFDPYWITTLHENVITDHSNITQKHFWCFIDLTLRESGALKSLTPQPAPDPEPNIELGEGLK